MSDTTTCEWCGRVFVTGPITEPYCSRKCENEDPNSSEHRRDYEARLKIGVLPSDLELWLRDSFFWHVWTRRGGSVGCLTIFFLPFLPFFILSRLRMMFEGDFVQEAGKATPQQAILGSLVMILIGVYYIWRVRKYRQSKDKK